ncbi:ubiquitin-like domain-containing protein [Halobacillus mangrovi]|uniref:ubiquitin-like domain-containing protein n=1 Tax=Halobacillus mangrovi TaxID=402384 RepID=UPI003D976F73
MGIKNGFKSISKRKLIFAFTIAILCMAFLTKVTYEATKASVEVTIDGESEIIRTHSNTISDLLSEANVTVQPHDELSHKLSAEVKDGMDVEYIPSKTISVTIDEQEKKYHTTADTVGDFIEEEELSLKKQDEVSHQTDTMIEAGMDLQIDKAVKVVLDDAGEEEKVWTTASTVGDFLENQEVTLNELDELKPAKSESLTEDTNVSITRVEKVTDIIEEDVDYSVETRKDDSLPKGERKVVSDGEQGVVTKKYEVTLTNGEETDRELIKETVEKESKKKIIAIGTKVEKTVRAASNSSSSQESTSSSSESSDEATTVSSSGDKSESKTLSMHATAYTANCSGCSGITATGINLKENPDKKVIAVDPSVIPLGSRVWVEGYGYAVAGDTGGAINGNRIDLFMSSKSEALSFGSRNVKVKILD